MDKFDLPQGFSMALTRNETAMKKFSNFTDFEKQSVIQYASGVKSKEEMQQLVDNIANSQGVD